MCICLDYPDYLYDFYLLYWALHDFEELGEQEYWPGTDRSNIHEVIDERFAAWFREHPQAPPSVAMESSGACRTARRSLRRVGHPRAAPGQDAHPHVSADPRPAGGGRGSQR